MTGRTAGAAAGLLLAAALSIGGTAVAAGAQVRPPGPDGIEFAEPAGQGWPEPPEVTASAFVLAEVSTGQVLAARAPDTPRPVASTVKMLTALTVLDRVGLDDVVEVGTEVTGIGGAGVGLRPGDRWTVAQLLDAMVARSGNDAAVALAVHVGGSVDGFVDLMRADARALGLTDVTLASPSGLQDANRLSPRALVTIARAVLDAPRLRAVAARRVVELPRLGAVVSRNLLLGSYRGANGIKTGQTDAAGWSLVASARRGARELVAVVLDSATDAGRFEDAVALLDHGFEAFERVPPVRSLRLRRGGEWVELAGADAAVLVPAGTPLPRQFADLPARIADGPVSATVSVVWEDVELARVRMRGVAARRPVSASAALGRWLADRAHASMRAVTVADAWPGGRQPGGG